MLLRRITKHVTDQNWFAVFIDFLIVVIGILLALQITNWNESKEDERLGKFYAKRLVNDLQRDLKLHQSITDYYQAVRESIIETDRLLATTEPDPKALIINAYRASEIVSDSAKRAIWDQILSSGHLGLLPKDTLTQGLIDYYRYDKQIESNQDQIANSSYRKVIRSKIPLPLQLKIRSGCSDDLTVTTEYIRGFATKCNLEVDREILKEVANNILSESQIKTEIRYHYSLISNRVSVAKRNANLVAQLIESLKNKGQK